MPTLASFDGTSLRYEEQGRGPTVVLLHGFAADAHLNWVTPGIADTLVDAGRRVVLPDARGHGRSDKPHDAAAYADDAMVRDVSALLDHLDHDTGRAADTGERLVDVVGYSMGALVAQRVAAVEPRVRSVVLGGIGAHLLEDRIDRRGIAAALESDDATSTIGRAFRAFARSTGGDLAALAASQRGGRPSVALLGDIRVPALVVAGEDDDLAGPPEPLAARIPGARAVRVPGDHLGAVAEPALRDAIAGFLADVSPVPPPS